MKKLFAVLIIAILAALAFENVVFGQPVSITIYGRGKAHGVGMSMAGVYGMAQAGYNYRQIASYYYPNTVFSTRDDNTIIPAFDSNDNTWHVVSVRDYLYRLAEEPDSWPKEGLRSLMIAARSYLWYKLGANNNTMPGGQYWIYTINPAVRSNIVAAVNDTANQILTYNNNPIIAAYSSSAGGYTAKMNEVWGGSDQPYLTNKESPFDSVFPSTYKWTKIITSADIEKAYPAVGQYQSFSISARTSSDAAKSRVKTVMINGSSESVTDTGYNFSNKLGLYSNYFYLTSWSEPAPQPQPQKPKVILQTIARKVIAKKYQWSRLWYQVNDSSSKNARVILIIKKGAKTVARIDAGVKACNKLAHSTVKFKRLPRGTYRYFVVAIDSSNNRTKNPGSNTLTLN